MTATLTPTATEPEIETATVEPAARGAILAPDGTVYQVPTAPPANDHAAVRRFFLRNDLSRKAVLPSSWNATAARREGEWAERLRPGDPTERWLVSQVALATVRLDEVQARTGARRALRSERAACAWDVDRCHEAEETGDRLAANPPRTVARLRRTARGCDWLIGRWEGLAFSARAAATEGRLAPKDRRRGLDLLGVPAGDVDGDPRLPESADVDAIERLALAEIEALGRLKAEAMDPLDLLERDLAEAGLLDDEGPATRQARRDESAHWRIFRWALGKLKEWRAEVKKPAPSFALPAAATLAPAPAEPEEIDDLDDEDELDDPDDFDFAPRGPLPAIVAAALAALPSTSPDEAQVNRRVRCARRKKARQAAARSGR